MENKPSYEALEIRVKELETLLFNGNSSNNATLLKASPDAIIISDFEGNIITLSQAATKLINLQNANQAIGLKIFDFLEEEEVERAIANISQMFSGIFHGPEIYLAKRLDGRKLYIEVNGEILRDEQGKPSQLIFIIRDVSSRQFAENELLKNHKFLTDLIENSGSLIYVKDLLGKYKLVNSRWESVTGINREEALGHSDEEIFSQILANQFIQKDALVIKEKSNLVTEEQIFNTTINNHFISNKYPLKDDNDKVIGVCNFSTDITELVATKEALQKKSLQFDNLVSKIPVGVYVIHSKPNGMFKFIYASNPMAKIVGLEIEDIQQDAMGTFNKVHPLDLDGFMKANLDALEKLTPFRYTARIIVGKEIKHIKFESFPDKLDNGEALWNGVISDITEQKIAKEDLALVNTNLKKLIIEKDRFFSILAHDLRGPINGILALIEMVSEDFDEIGTDELRKMITGMNTSATNVKRLLDNLLEWAGMQQGKIPFEPIVMDVFKAIENAVNLMTNQARLKNIEISFDAKSNHQMFADSHMLDSILRNLISNAIKFTPKGGKISIHSEIKDANTMQISIADTGIGMDKSILQKLFMIHEKTNRKGTDGEPSAGLGLILCKDFVSKNGGEIWAESQENKGSTFSFTVPINQEAN